MRAIARVGVCGCAGVRVWASRLWPPSKRAQAAQHSKARRAAVAAAAAAAVEVEAAAVARPDEAWVGVRARVDRLLIGLATRVALLGRERGCGLRVRVRERVKIVR